MKPVKHKPQPRHHRQLLKLYRLTLALKRTRRAEVWEDRHQVRMEVAR